MIKHYIISILGLLLLSLSVFAQPRLEVPELYFGFHGGAVAGMMRFSPTVQQSAKSPLLGGTGGLVFRYGNTKFTAVQLELNYLQRGWHETATDYTRHLDYIEIPLLMHLYFGKQVRGFLNLGPEFGYCIAQYDKNGENLSGPQYEPIEKPWDWGLAAGLGMQVNAKRAGAYFLEVRFDFSFGDVFSNRATDYFRNSAPMALSLNLGWMWYRQ